MRIKIKLIGPLIYQAGFSEKVVEVEAGTTSELFLEGLALPKDRPRIVTRNGKAITSREILEEGDRIAVSPIYSGG